MQIWKVFWLASRDFHRIRQLDAGNDMYSSLAATQLESIVSNLERSLDLLHTAGTSNKLSGHKRSREESEKGESVENNVVEAEELPPPVKLNRRSEDSCVLHHRAAGSSSGDGCASVAVRNPNVRLPPDMYCPITMEVMQDPVVADDGHSYERLAMELWLVTNHNTSPLTNQPLRNLQLIPNHTLKKCIQFAMQLATDAGKCVSQ
eukprot:TRINITY_DN8384_c0_g2_i1.p2 TRINITY_DN8384_c0_g2~~TRINITY_DN8384_c0_g2_i1.p2  ORF type:complete len:205 (-),score=52.53 TRINITY_DN8384_c0_g2_i1:47-661(-)